MSDAFVIDSIRTPIGRFGGALAPVRPDDLAAHAIEALRRAGKIDIYAAGSSYVTGEHARIRLYRIGKRCITYCDPSQQSVSASLLTKKDVAIGISNSGSTIATVRALGQAKESGATTICITNHELSPLTKFADIKLFTSTQNSAFFQQSMVSWVAQMLIIDIICSYDSYS